MIVDYRKDLERVHLLAVRAMLAVVPAVTPQPAAAAPVARPRRDAAAAKARQLEDDAAELTPAEQKLVAGLPVELRAAMGRCFRTLAALEAAAAAASCRAATSQRRSASAAGPCRGAVAEDSGRKAGLTSTRSFGCYHWRARLEDLGARG
jgi:hypothetical protein